MGDLTTFLLGGTRYVSNHKSNSPYWSIRARRNCVHSYTSSELAVAFLDIAGLYVWKADCCSRVHMLDPCHSLGCWSLAVHFASQCSVCGNSIWRLWWTNTSWNGSFSERLDFPLSFFILPVQSKGWTEVSGRSFMEAFAIHTLRIKITYTASVNTDLRRQKQRAKVRYVE